MSLHELQCDLLQLLRSGGTASADPYLAEVVASEGLEAVREIAASWNRFSVEQLCPLTCRLLEQRGELGDAVAEVSGADLPSAFVEDLAVVFLEQRVRAAPESVVADVARFEAAVLRLSSGRNGVETVEWHHDPDVVIGAVLAGARIDDVAGAGAGAGARAGAGSGSGSGSGWCTEVCLDWPSLYRVCE